MSSGLHCCGVMELLCHLFFVVGQAVYNNIDIIKNRLLQNIILCSPLLVCCFMWIGPIITEILTINQVKTAFGLLKHKFYHRILACPLQYYTALYVNTTPVTHFIFEHKKNPH